MTVEVQRHRLEAPRPAGETIEYEVHSPSRPDRRVEDEVDAGLRVEGLVPASRRPPFTAVRGAEHHLPRVEGVAEGVGIEFEPQPEVRNLLAPGRPVQALDP